MLIGLHDEQSGQEVLTERKHQAEPQSQNSRTYSLTRFVFTNARRSPSKAR